MKIYLGRHIWGIFILIAKGGKRVGMLGRLWNYLTVGAANTLCKSRIAPIFNYWDIVWFCVNRCDADGLKRLQRRAAKIVSMFSSSDTAMQILKWVPQETGKDNYVCKLVKKCLTKSPVPSQLYQLKDWSRQESLLLQWILIKLYYYSVKTFPQFWLAKRTLIIHHNKLLMTKFGGILCLARKWRQKCSPLQVKAPLPRRPGDEVELFCLWEKKKKKTADISLVSRVRTKAGTRRNNS